MALMEEHSLPMAGVLLLFLLWLGAGAPKKAPKLLPGQSRESKVSEEEQWEFDQWHAKKQRDS
jgi:hypothetical protein